MFTATVTSSPNYRVFRSVREVSKNNRAVVETKKYDDGSVEETILEGVHIVRSYNSRRYYPGSAYEGAIHCITEYSDGVTMKQYVRSFDEWPGAD